MVFIHIEIAEGVAFSKVVSVNADDAQKPVATQASLADSGVLRHGNLPGGTLLPHLPARLQPHQQTASYLTKSFGKTVDQSFLRRKIDDMFRLDDFARDIINIA